MALVCTTSAFVIKSIQESSTSADPQSEQQGELTSCPTDGFTVYWLLHTSRALIADRLEF